MIETKDIATDWNDITYKIQNEIIETTEEFIFKTILPYCSQVEQRVINKKELITALEKAEKYKWHYLRKDPNDLPICDDYEDVLALFNLESSYGTTYGTIYAKNVRSDDHRIIAWKYIEPFEEKE